MAGSILTPATLWEKFNINNVPEAELIEEKTEKGITVSKVYIDGQLTKSGRVKIFATVTRKSDLSVMPAVVIANGLKCDCQKYSKMANMLAKNGYMVLSIDVGGRFEGKELFTIYPEDISYADYENARGRLAEVKTTAKETCWYEWGKVLRYALAYLKNQSSISKIGVIGIKSSSTLIWQLAATEPYLACAVSVMGAGWSVCKGIPKFSDKLEPQFSDETLKYVAGIEAQSYAKNVLCPMLALVATNNDSYDCDRVQDTLARINGDIYRASNYSTNFVTGIGEAGIDDTLLFLDRFLKGNESIKLPSEPQIKSEIVDKKIVVTITADSKELKEVHLFASEGEKNSYLRSWKKLSGGEVKAGGNNTVLTYVYQPVENSDIACFFAKAEYENGFNICSSVVANRFKVGDVLPKRKSGILYSGREEFAESVFCPYEFAIPRENEYFLDSKEKAVTVSSGPMGIDGVSAESGLFTFRVNSSGINLSNDSILMLDVYSKEKGELKITLFADYFGEKTEFFVTVPLCGGRVWQNVKVDIARFKTAEGRPIKFAERLNALNICADGKYLINNVLWL